MLDFYNLPDIRDGNSWFLTGGNITTTNGSHIWHKPRGIQCARFLLVGAGGGGASGTTAVSRGGGGGGSGAAYSFIMDVGLLPDVLQFTIGAGGVGATGTANPGTAGGSTIVYGFNSLQTLLTVGGGGGGIGSTSAGGAVGTATETIWNRSAYVNDLAGIGSVGAAGATGAGGDERVNIGGSIVSNGITGGAGGGGGGSPSGTGGNVTVAFGFPTVGGGASVLTGNNGLPGDHGYSVFKPLLFCTGGGGGSGAATTFTGGTGGVGGFGCGGGGGGGGGSGGGIGGSGGKGGDGFIYINCW